MPDERGSGIERFRAWLGRRGGSGAHGGEPTYEPARSGLASPTERALDAWSALLAGFGQRRRGALLLRDGPGRLALPAAVWPVSQFLAAALDVAVITGDQQPFVEAAAGVERYRAGDGYGAHPGAGTGGRYYDDNAWIGLDFVQAHLQTGESRWLDAASRVFRFVAEGEAPGGGVYWVEHPRRTRHACSTAPAVELALHLYAATGDRDHLDFAERNDAWLQLHLRSPDDLVWDNVGDDGAVERTHWSYNQGTPVGAAVLLARATGDERHLDRADAMARAALAHYAADDRLWRQPAVFNAVFLRNLLLLHATRPLAAIPETLHRYLDRVWAEARDPATGLLLGGGIGRYEGGGAIDQAGLVQLFALAAWPPDRWADVT